MTFIYLNSKTGGAGAQFQALRGALRGRRLQLQNRWREDTQPSTPKWRHTVARLKDRFRQQLTTQSHCFISRIVQLHVVVSGAGAAS